MLIFINGFVVVLFDDFCVLLFDLLCEGFYFVGIKKGCN